MSASCCAASHMAMMILSDHTAARLFHDADRLLLERRKLFSCKGQKGGSNPITSYLTGDKMDGIRDPPSTGNSSYFFCCIFFPSFLSFLPFSLPVQSLWD